jgi:anti-sigma factor RsiW
MYWDKDVAMKCKTIQNSLSAYLDRELGPETVRAVEDHIGGCAACRAALEETEKAWALLGTLPDARPAPFLFTRVSARLSESVRPRRRAWLENVLIPATAAVVTMLGLWLGSVTGRNGDAAAVSASERADDPVLAQFEDNFNDFPAASMSQVYFTIHATE